MTETIFSGLISFLESKPEIKDVKLTPGQPTSTSEISSWERVHQCALPEDARNFYLSSNGITLSWSYQYNDAVLQLGEIKVHPLSQLTPLHLQGRAGSGGCGPGGVSKEGPSLLDLDRGNTLVGGSWKPSFGGACKIFALDYNPTNGHICLVYNTETESQGDMCTIWLLDLALCWHSLCPSLSDYLRLAVVHLGLLQWPYAFTPYGLSPQYEKWFHMFIPKRLELDFKHMAQQKDHTHKHSGHAQELPLAHASSSKQESDSEMQCQQFLNHFDPSKVLFPKSLKDKRSKVHPGTTAKKTTVTK